ncbi:MAG TPA: hypothetical protein DEA85_05235, partial [Firmicutes bacterium]|nr:hypothetical protein [Bacillota bacterium]
GHSIGVKLAESGVIVAGLDSIMTGTGKVEPAKESGFEVGDILVAVDDVELKNLGHAAAVLEELSRPGEELDCQIIRRGRKLSLAITPVYD